MWRFSTAQYHLHFTAQIIVIVMHQTQQHFIVRNLFEQERILLLYPDYNHISTEFAKFNMETRHNMMFAVPRDFVVIELMRHEA